jgi:large subunit ribosomal protein L10
MTVAEITVLRKKIREAEAGFLVTKNSLARLALEGSKFSGVSALFNGPTAVAYSSDPVTASKVIVDYAKSNDKLVILGGGLENEVIDPSVVNNLSKLPSLDELRAKIISIVQTPATRIVGVLQAPGGQVARVLGAYASKGNS